MYNMGTVSTFKRRDPKVLWSLFWAGVSNLWKNKWLIIASVFSWGATQYMTMTLCVCSYVCLSVLPSSMISLSKRPSLKCLIHFYRRDCYDVMTYDVMTYVIMTYDVMYCSTDTDTDTLMKIHTDTDTRYRHPKVIPIPTFLKRCIPMLIPIPISEKFHWYQKLYRYRYSLDSWIIRILYQYYTDILPISLEFHTDTDTRINFYTNTNIRFSIIPIPIPKIPTNTDIFFWYGYLALV